MARLGGYSASAVPLLRAYVKTPAATPFSEIQGRFTVMRFDILLSGRFGSKSNMGHKLTNSVSHLVGFRRQHRSVYRAEVLGGSASATAVSGAECAMSRINAMS